MKPAGKFNLQKIWIHSSGRAMKTFTGSAHNEPFAGTDGFAVSTKNKFWLYIY